MSAKLKTVGIIVAIFFSFIPLVSEANAPASVPNELLPKKKIDINLTEQRLRYYLGDAEVGNILISSGVKWYPTPPGEFTVRQKIPFVNYFGRNSNGTYYNFPHTKWNLLFLPRYYIHGAYWHNAFGTPRSHGCVNVSYRDMEQLYNFADVGTPVYVHY
ncbi:MAG: hypothetical protein CEN90_206 [Parcubacteria group bacterium Licking1014_17]|nr:MAG: hypothetical protein CEN90_206 [Parcubacteria group bacterium Licking1014_17]